ncbi:MAG: hypothetical protein ACJ8AI_32570, partial [Rhodopila sp.]
ICLYPNTCAAAKSPGQSQVWLDQQDDRVADGGESVGSPAQPSAWMAAGWPGGKPEPTYTNRPNF